MVSALRLSLRRRRLAPSIDSYGTIMLAQGARELMPAMAAGGHEIEVINRGWSNRCLDGPQAGIGDGAGSEAGLAIGIIGRIKAQIGLA